MVEDTDWLDLVEEGVRLKMKGTVLENAPIIRVSAKTGVGLENIQEALIDVMEDIPPQIDHGRPRLPIDRVFKIAGFGTVVTGTLLDGSFQVGDEVHVMPGNTKGRIRGLQTHKNQVETAQPGSRTAINISGLDANEIERGQIVVHPDQVTETRRIDVHFRLLPDVAHPLEHDQDVKLFIGAAEVMARVRLIGTQIMKPGDESWLQLEPVEPIVVVKGDRYILRRPSPGETLGGGVILDPYPKWRYKRFDEDTLQRLQALTEGTPEDVIVEFLERSRIAQFAEIIQNTGLEIETALESANDLLASGDLLLFGDEEKITNNSKLASKTIWDRSAKDMISTVNVYHNENSLRKGMPREELKSKLKLDNKVFNLLFGWVTDNEMLMEKGPLVWVPGYEIKLSDEQQKKIDLLLAEFEREPFSPPTIKTCIEKVGEQVYQAMLELGLLITISSDVAFKPATYEKAVTDIKELIEKNGPVTLGQARDHWGTTRRYVQALLEYMDQQGITKRDGDTRVLR
jgi:selenocysteine-specific elongation factor